MIIDVKLRFRQQVTQNGMRKVNAKMVQMLGGTRDNVSCARGRIAGDMKICRVIKRRENNDAYVCMLRDAINIDFRFKGVFQIHLVDELMCDNDYLQYHSPGAFDAPHDALLVDLYVG